VLVPERGFANIVVRVERVVNKDLRVEQLVELGRIIIRHCFRGTYCLL